MPSGSVRRCGSSAGSGTSASRRSPVGLLKFARFVTLNRSTYAIIRLLPLPGSLNRYAARTFSSEKSGPRAPLNPPLFSTVIAFGLVRRAAVGASRQRLLEDAVPVRIRRAVGERERRAAVVLPDAAEVQAARVRHFDGSAERQDMRPILIAQRHAIVHVQVGDLRRRIDRRAG